MTQVPFFIERLASFVRGLPNAEPMQQTSAARAGVTLPLEELGHHIVILGLVARADDHVHSKERQVIYRYCLDRAEKAGRTLTGSEKQAVQDYVSAFYPPLSLLDEAVERLKSDSKAELEALLDAAHEVIAADHVYRIDEISFLVTLKRELAALAS